MALLYLILLWYLVFIPFNFNFFFLSVSSTSLFYPHHYLFIFHPFFVYTNLINTSFDHFSGHWNKSLQSYKQAKRLWSSKLSCSPLLRWVTAASLMLVMLWMPLIHGCPVCGVKLAKNRVSVRKGATRRGLYSCEPVREPKYSLPDFCKNQLRNDSNSIRVIGFHYW